MSPTLTILSVIKQRRLFILVTGVLLLLILVIQIINRRFWMHDFEVYYKAAEAFSDGSKVYGKIFGLESGYYKYSPFALYLFLPLSLLPFEVAKIIFFLLISAATIATLMLAAHILENAGKSGRRYSDGILFLVLGIVSSQVFRELHMGNVNMLLLLLMLIMLWHLMSGKQITAGILFAIVLFIKPHFIILVPLLLLRKQYKSLAVTILSLSAGILLPAILIGVSANIDLYKEWLFTMRSHNESLLEAYDTIYSLALRPLSYLQLFNIRLNEKTVTVILIFLVAISFGWFVIRNILRERKTQLQHTGQAFAIEFLLLIALIPNLLITDSEHFLLSIPLILFLLGLMYNKTYFWFNLTVIIAIVLYAMNIHDLVGAAASLWLRNNGILGLGNLILIGLTIYGYLNIELKTIRNDKSNRSINQ